MTSTAVSRHHATTSRAVGAEQVQQGLEFINWILKRQKQPKKEISLEHREIITKIQSAIQAAKSKTDERDPCNENNLFSSIYSIIRNDYKRLKRSTSKIIPHLKQIEQKIDADGCSMALITPSHEMHGPSLEEEIPWGPPNKSGIGYLRDALDELIKLPDAPFDRKNVAKLRVDMHEAKEMYIPHKTRLWKALNKDLNHHLGKTLDVDGGTMTNGKLVAILSDGGAAVMHKTADQFFKDEGIRRIYVGTRHPKKRESEAQTAYNNMYSDFDQYYGGYNGIDHVHGGYNDIDYIDGAYNGIDYIDGGYNNIDYDINSNDNYHMFDMEIFIGLTMLFAMCIIYGICCFLFTVSSAFIWNCRKNENDPRDQSMNDVTEI